MPPRGAVSNDVGDGCQIRGPGAVKQLGEEPPGGERDWQSSGRALSADSRRIIRSTLPRAAPSTMSRFFGGLSVEEMAELLPILR